MFVLYFSKNAQNRLYLRMLFIPILTVNGVNVDSYSFVKKGFGNGVLKILLLRFKH